MSNSAEQEGAARPLAIPHAEMNAAIEQGTAIPLSRGHGWLVRHLDAWWVEYEGGWLRVIDPVATRDLDQVAERLAEANGFAAAETAERLSGDEERADGDGPAGGQQSGTWPANVEPGHYTGRP